MKTIRTRFAPSPTGALHIGGLRTALYSYALAKSTKGDFILRIEDTDKKREVLGGVANISKILTAFGLSWDEYYIQSELAKDGRYLEAAEKLVSTGQAFYCDCQPKNAKEGFSKELRDPCRDKGKSKGAVKLKVPDNQKVAYVDFVLGKEISWETNVVSDTTLLKSDGLPTYHLAVVVDDNQMKISHVLRGHDWLPSTPIHLLIYKFLDFDVPEIGHLTDILDPEGGKLSKRKGSTTCEALLKEGYLPEAILNFVMLLGWAPKDNREIYSLNEFVKTFDINGLQKANPVFNRAKLDWFNGQYIRSIEPAKLASLIKDFSKEKLTEPQTRRILDLIKDRLIKLADFDELAKFFFAAPVYSADLWENGKESLTYLNEGLAVIKKCPCTKTDLEEGLQGLVKEKEWPMGQFFMSLRIAVCGSRFTPPIIETIVVLGKEESIKRITAAISSL